MMNVISVIYFVMMIGVHAPAAWLVQRNMLRGLDEPTRRAVTQDLRRYWIRLVIAQMALVIVAISWLLYSGGALEFGVQTATGGIAFYGFHAIWWPFVFPFMLRLDKSMRAHGVVVSSAQPGPVRRASLRARKVSEYLPSWSTPLEVALVVIGITTVAVRALTAPGLNTALLWSAGMFALWAVVFVVGYAFWIRMEVQQSYSWLAGNSTEEEIEAHRRFRVRGIFALQIAAAATFFAASALVIEVARGTISGSTVGLIGGIAGTVIGLGGGVFGTIASLRAAKLQRARQYRKP
jgi:hypothetical protein